MPAQSSLYRKDVRARPGGVLAPSEGRRGAARLVRSTSLCNDQPKGQEHEGLTPT